MSSLDAMTRHLPVDEEPTPTPGSGPATPPASPAPAQPRRASVGRLLRQPGLVLATIWLALVAVAALAPSVLTGRDPLATETSARLQGPSLDHLLGTDQLGRDAFARVVHGAGLSLTAAAVATGLGIAIGTLLGVLAGFVRGVVDTIVMRLVDVLLSIPAVLLALAMIAVLGPGTGNVAIAIGVASVATCARVMRAEVLRVRESPYVEAAHATGSTWWRVLLRHVVPNAMGPVWVLATLMLGVSILAVSSLSFLGYGAQPPEPEWGALVSDGRDYLRQAWWLSVLPGAAVALTVLAANRVSLALDRTGRIE